MESAETAQALLTVTITALTQLGIPAVFLIAWYMTWKTYTRQVNDHLRDLRRCAGLTIPEDVLSSGTGSGD